MTRQEEVFCHDHQERSKVRDEVLPHLHPFPLGFGSAAEDRLNDGGPYPCPTEESRWGRPPYPSELKKIKPVSSSRGTARDCVLDLGHGAPVWTPGFPCSNFRPGTPRSVRGAESTFRAQGRRESESGLPPLTS